MNERSIVAEPRPLAFLEVFDPGGPANLIRANVASLAKVRA
jgi:hypothetical protein